MSKKEVKKSSKKKKILLGTLIPIGVLGAFAGAGVAIYATGVTVYRSLSSDQGNYSGELSVNKLGRFGVHVDFNEDTPAKFDKLEAYVNGERIQFKKVIKIRRERNTMSETINWVLSDENRVIASPDNVPIELQKGDYLEFIFNINYTGKVKFVLHKAS